VLIISAGSDVAMEIANWVIQIITGWDILACMRPDRQHGDRSSAKAFDIHWQLKGAEKSPSVACIGITANMQGRRADLLIPDDIESSKNGITENQRAALEHLSKDFTSICQKGRIMYLGTPQTVDSIYNNLPSRGFTIRVWPGRYPTAEEEPHYEGVLAPFILKRMSEDPTLRIGGGLTGDRGKPVDPLLLGEDLLTDKERDQGASYFNLQHMLNTTMSDELRNPLKIKNVIFANFGIEEAPGSYTWLPSKDNLIRLDNGSYQCRPEMYRAFKYTDKLYKYEGKHIYVDNAGGGKNGDETVAAVTYFLHGYIFVAEIMKLPGGYSESGYTALSELALKHQVNSIEVEKNFGFGAFAAAWRPVLHKKYEDAGFKHSPAIEDVWETGQKELRIIDTIEPVLARHKLVMHEDIIDYDLDSVIKYPVDQRESYKFIHQFCKITRDKAALIHDDSIDAVAGSIRKWVEMIAVDDQKRIASKETDENVSFFAEWGAEIGKSGKSLGNSTDRFSKTAKRKQSSKKQRMRI